MKYRHQLDGGREWGGVASKGRVMFKKNQKEKTSLKGQSHFLKRYLTVGRLTQSQGEGSIDLLGASNILFFHFGCWFSQSKPMSLSQIHNAGANLYNLHFCSSIWLPIKLFQSVFLRGKVGGQSRDVFLPAACSSWVDHLSKAFSLQQSHSFL